MKYIRLNNGIEMPQLGLGTFLVPSDMLSQTIKAAYDLGYRQFDTAWKYRNENDIASALKEHGIPRENVFLTTKFNACALHYGKYKYGRRSIFNIRNFKTIKGVIQESFDNLGTDYIDLFLIHYPFPKSHKIWYALSELYKEGHIKAIGVSNFLQPHLAALKDFSDIVPAVNQFEISPLNTQKQLIRYCQQHGIAVQAMSTFSHFRSVEPRKEIFESPILIEIAKHHRRSVAQIVLRWLQQQDIIMIPKTWNIEHLRENISIFDFELNDEEMSAIDSMDGGHFLNYEPHGQQQGFVKRHRDWEGFIEWNKDNKLPIGKILKRRLGL